MDKNRVKEGRVLRVKSGYNPNSSSVGSSIPTFFFFAIGTGVVTIIVSQFLYAIGGLIKKDRNSVEVKN
jgi:hypothetical protein